jgi:Protein of unknown function (DUF1553)/Protein of unknown function (DUF1549)
MSRRRSLLTLVISVTAVWSGCARAPAPVAPAPVTRAIATPTPTPSPAVAADAGHPAAKPDPPPALSLNPAEATLEPGDLGLQFIASLPGRHGGQRDATAEVAWEAEPAGIVQVGADGYLKPLAAGKATVRASKGDMTAQATVTIVTTDERPWDFGTEIMPVLTRNGCNLGGCHGKADGQNGFHLSIFGYDADGDHTAITRDADGRRISRFDPTSSLILLKAIGQIPHGGGQRFTRESDAYKTMRDWIVAGAPRSSGKTHGALTKVVVEPKEIRLDEPGGQQLRVVAHYADGHERDVTRLATYRVNDELAAEVDAGGKAKLLKRAEVDLIVRYQSNVVATRLATVVNPDLKLDFSKLPRRNFIDDELFKRLASLKVPPSPPASDEAFLRRISLDMIAHQPEPEEIKSFVADKDPDKRVKKVDELLKHKDFVKFWEIKLGDMLQITSNRFQNGGAGRYQLWLQNSLMKNTPWDVMTRELLTAVGDPASPDGGAANYALDGPDAKSKAEQTAQRFLGLRIRCAQCHDHPFDVWTQDDYFHLAAFFAKTGIGAGPGVMMNRPAVKVDPKGTVEHLRTKKPATPRLLNGGEVKLRDDEDPRKSLADWITSADNPFFAREMANWVWAQLFGKGIADPPDDLSRSNPPVHPELLDALAKHFVEHKYDLRDLIRTIAASQAYGLSSTTVPGNERDQRFFSHHLPRSLTAHQMADALAQVTGVINRFQNRASGTRAIDVFDPSQASPILDTFGRCSRQSGCSAVATPSLSLRQALLLIGGDAIDSKVSSLNGYLASAMQYDPEPGDLVENLYLRTICRYPTPEETSRWTAELKAATSLREAAEDLFWALLNSREFAFNH